MARTKTNTWNTQNMMQYIFLICFKIVFANHLAKNFHRFWQEPIKYKPVIVY